MFLLIICIVLIIMICIYCLNNKIVEGMDQTQNCIGTYDQYYGSCSKTCGGGTQKLAFNVDIDPVSGYFRGNQKEPVPCPLDLTRECNTHNCPIDCEYVGGGDGWSNWIKNLDSNGKQIGTETRTRQIRINEKYGGIPCGKLTETRKHDVNCGYSGWSNRGACSKPCGGGTQTRTRSILQEPKNGGNPCGELEQTQNCNTQGCPVDCVLSDWKYRSYWGCSGDCGRPGTRLQTKDILTAPAWGGKACGTRYRYVSCNTGVCNIPNGIYTLKGGRSGNYCADEGSRIICNRGAAYSWEKFTMTRHGDKYVLKGGATGKYCADEGNRIICNRGAIGPWEKFTIVKHGNKYALKGGRYSKSKYCSDEGNGIICNSDDANDKEQKFTISRL